MVTSETAEAVEAGAPVGPDEAEEAALLAEQRTAGSATALPPAAQANEDANVPLPPMDELIQRIPASIRELMDQLFRAKFVTVKRIPTSAFKTQI